MAKLIKAKDQLLVAESLVLLSLSALLNQSVQVASLCFPVMPMAATNGRFRVLMVGTCTGRCHRRGLLLRATS
jgi:hypothetical protein